MSWPDWRGARFLGFMLDFLKQCYKVSFWMRPRDESNNEVIESKMLIFLWVVLSSIMDNIWWMTFKCFQASNSILRQWLCSWCCIKWKKDQVNCLQTFTCGIVRKMVTFLSWAASFLSIFYTHSENNCNGQYRVAYVERGKQKSHPFHAETLCYRNEL